MAWKIITNFKTIRRMTNLNMIAKSNSNDTSKCEIHVQAKHTRKFFPNIKYSDPLELICGVYDSNKVPDNEGRRYL